MAATILDRIAGTFSADPSDPGFVSLLPGMGGKTSGGLNRSSLTAGGPVEALFPSRPAETTTNVEHQVALVEEKVSAAGSALGRQFDREPGGGPFDSRLAQLAPLLVVGAVVVYLLGPILNIVSAVID